MSNILAITGYFESEPIKIYQLTQNGTADGLFDLFDIPLFCNLVI